MSVILLTSVITYAIIVLHITRQVSSMKQITITKARDDIYNIVNSVSESHEPVLLTGKKNAVILSQDDWESIQETLYLLSIPGMHESLIEGMNTPTDQCFKDSP